MLFFGYLGNGLPSVLTLLCLPLFTILGGKFWALFPKSSNDNQQQQQGMLIMGGGYARKQEEELPRRYLWTSIFYVAVHSLIAHKEHRFLLPIIPLLIPSLVTELDNLFGKLHIRLDIPVRMEEGLKRAFIWLTALLNVGMALYLGLVHQRGPNAAAGLIYSQVLQQHPDATIQILQLMPSFSMGQYSAFHPHGSRLDIRMLDCTAGLGQRGHHQVLEEGQVEEEEEEELEEHEHEQEEGREPQDEADKFHNDPLGWLRENWPLVEANKAQTMQIIVAYEKTYRRIRPFVEPKNFVVLKTIFHSHFLTSSNQDFRIVISVRVA